jgi:hypothetical protein
MADKFDPMERKIKTKGLKIKTPYQQYRDTEE